MDERVEPLGYPSYTAYLFSPHWRNLRRRYRAQRGWLCVLCHKQAHELHHQTYERLGAERLSDLAALCQPCHAKVHQRSSGDLWVRRTKKKPDLPKRAPARAEPQKQPAPKQKKSRRPKPKNAAEARARQTTTKPQRKGKVSWRIKQARRFPP